MLPEKIQLDIVTPERAVLSEAVDELILPGTEGYLGVRPGHAPLLTTLKLGSIMIRKGNDRQYLAVSWGFVEVLPEQVSILAETAERAEEIDVDRAVRAKERAEQRLKSPDPDVDFQRAQVALEKALIRIQVASRAGAASRGEI
ncbi:MAG: F0F1 ATP synthase subunit epsilon [Acidobacteria bacterium]|nr:F0F1 ATP synthase subunit epsilon [Acidobacteriota bacterium]MCI0568150.1 F0F1 ATP synthase subunit epsilon [Acidobacteriota bacterium]